MSIQLLKNEILEPKYVMCNECMHLGENVLCDVYKSIPPQNILNGNLFKKKKNEDICKHFKLK